MKIVIVSDSHGKNETLRYAIGQELPFDLLIHAGDIQAYPDEILPPEKRDYEILCVRGNCDYFQRELPMEILYPIKGDCWQRNIYINHGKQFNVSPGDDASLLDHARHQLADIVIYGHIHQPRCYETDDGLLVINPGSVSEPRQQEYDYQATYAVLTIDEDGFPSAAIKTIPDRIRR